MTVTATSTKQLRTDPLSVQDRLKDMQSLLILKNIRGHHDSDPTVLSAIDHAISILQKRSEKKEEESDADFRLAFLRKALELVQDGKGYISNIGVDREVEQINVASLNDGSARRIAGRSQVKYNIEIIGELNP